MTDKNGGRQINGDEGDNVGEISQGFSAESYPEFTRNELRGNPGEIFNQITCPNQDRNRGPEFRSHFSKAADCLLSYWTEFDYNEYIFARMIYVYEM